MRLPNGYGGIRELKDKPRRNRFQARILSGYKQSETSLKIYPVYKTLGYYKTKKDAMQALAEYNTDPYDLEKAEITFAQMFDMAAEHKFTDISVSAERSYHSAYNYFEPLYKAKFRDLKAIDYERVINEDTVPRTMRSNCVKVLHMMYAFAIKYEYVNKDYSAVVDFNIDNTTQIERKIIMPEEIEDLIGKKNELAADMALVATYTGLRPAELWSLSVDTTHIEDRYFIGGVKTKSGKNRIIPIHKEIYPIVQDLYESAKKSESGLLFRNKIGNAFNCTTYGRLYSSVLPGHTPYDTRHTFATVADKCNMKPTYRKRIMGHALKDITEDVYTHVDYSMLVEAVDNLVFH